MVCQAGQEEWIMSNRTREINKITTTIISISVKLIVYALIVLLLYEAVAKGYAFGHEIFYAEAVEAPPGHDMVVQMTEGESVSEAAEFLARRGLIKSEFAFIFQSKFYDYDTIYPGTYTLNTSMTSKEILQMLNEKPETEEDVKPAQSGGGKAAAAPAARTVGSARNERLLLRLLPVRQGLPGMRTARRPLHQAGPWIRRRKAAMRWPTRRPTRARTRRWKADGLRT